MKDLAEYKVLARKYRPQSFKDVVGQDSIVLTLKNAIRLKRVAHAYLFCGCRGTGKTTLARLFAKTLNCAFLSEELEPCNQCASCQDIAAGHSLDVLEIDGASHRGIEDIRKINETIGFVPTNGKYKIVLIDEVHMLTKEAFNALLKTLEEPPSSAKFFFATTEPHKIPATILSRCQRFNLGRIAKENVVAKLKSISQDLQILAEDEALCKIAELSEGSLRDAESLFDQVISYQREKITLEAVSSALGLASKDLLFALDQAGKEKRLLAAFDIAEQIFSSGKNASYFVDELILHFRTLFLVKQKALMPTFDKEKYLQSASFYREEQILEILDLLIESANSLKFSSSEKTALEMLLLKILRSHQRISLESLVERLESLERGLSFSEDPMPKPHEIPSSAPLSRKEEPKRLAIQEKPAAKELGGDSLKKEPLKEEVKKPAQENTQKNHPKEAKQIQTEKEEPKQKLTVREQSRFDTLMHFTAKELNGSLKKEY